MEKKYWIFIYPHVFIYNKHGKSLFYNSDTGDSIFCETNSKILELCEPDNMYSVIIDETFLIKDSVFNEIISKCFGELIPFSKDRIKPVSIFPRCLVEKQMYEDYTKVDFNACLSEFTELTLMLTGICSLDCAGCDYAYKQRLWCHKKPLELPFKKIKNFLKFIPFSSLGQINLVGGDIFSYHHIEELFSFLEQFSLKKRFIIYYKLLPDYMDKLSVFSQKDFTLELLLDPLFDKNLLIKIINQLTLYNVNFVMSVFSVEDYKNATNLASDNNIEVDIIPIFNGENYSFFENNVFIDGNDILNSSPTMKNIFAHQLINTNTFGKLIVFPDGEIYANVNRNSLGSIGDDIYKIIYSQLSEGSDWRSIRNNHICSDCLLQWLCPSPSGYNDILNKDNLCHHPEI